MLTAITNALTIDVEDYFQVSAFEAVCDPCTWDGRECRVEANTRRILRILEEAEVRATFFVLGWVAERYPALVREISAAGHEVASHGYGHRRVYHQTRKDFRNDIRRSKTLLEDLAGQQVLGYRAPSYSISQETLWAFDELVEAGYSYDSSVFPIRHDLYGMPHWPRFPFRVEKMGGENWVPAEPGARSSRFPVPSSQLEVLNPEPGNHSSKLGTGNSERLLEVPITTLRLLGRNLPIAGGGYFRLFPYWLTRRGLKCINRRDERAFVFYLHPWEIDPGQPRIHGAGLKSRFRHCVNLGKTENRLRNLLSDFCFGPICNLLIAESSTPRAEI